jgi:succinate-semialdehyde dehydrogenase
VSTVCALGIEQIGATGFVRDQAYIAGQWVSADRSLAVENPADGTLVGHVPVLGAEETHEAIRAAREAGPAWAALTPGARGRVLRRWADLMRQSIEDLALLITLEQGKPLAESRGEIEYGAGFLDWFAAEGERAYGRTIPSHRPGSHLRVISEPIGVVGVVTPWNFPSAMIARKVGAAMAAGCSVVVLPAKETPLSALALAVLAQEAGVPDGVFSVVTGEPEPIFDAMVEDRHVRAISFTGSTRVGRLVAAKSAATVKKVSLELGGHAPFIVFDDADIEQAAQICIAAKFATSGQDCLSPNRIYVHEDVHDEFVEHLARGIRALTVGAGTDERVDIGPMISEAAANKVNAHVQDALAHGAEAIVGGNAYEGRQTFVEPTLLTGVRDTMLVAIEETFGPVAPVLSFTSDDEVVQRANDSEYGLAAYVVTTSLRRAEKMSAALEYGMVAVNTPSFTGAPIPFGGVKQSGLGREGAVEGLAEFSELKYICVGQLD